MKSLEDVVKQLDKAFTIRYGKKFADLNKNVYPAAKNDKGAYEVPVPRVGKGGGTLIVGPSDPYKLEPPATVSVDLRNMKEQVIVYRLAIPYSECEIASNKPEYFNYLFDAIVEKAIGNYRVTVGDENKVRFGSHYISFNRPGNDKDVFRQLEDTSLELRFYGSWASAEEAYD